MLAIPCVYGISCVCVSLSDHILKVHKITPSADVRDNSFKIVIIFDDTLKALRMRENLYLKRFPPRVTMLTLLYVRFFVHRHLLACACNLQ